MRLRSTSLLSAFAVVSLVTMGGVSVAASAEEPIEVTTLDTLSDRIAAAAEGGASPEEISEAASLPVEGGGSLSFDADQRVSATVFFDGAPTAATLAALGEIAEIDQLVERFAAAEIRVAPEALPAVAEINGVLSATPSLSPLAGRDRSAAATAGLRESLAANGAFRTAAEQTSGEQCGPVPIEADAPLRADLARGEFDVDGTGVTIGIISDSFGQLETPKSVAEDIAAGALPGPDNPCGWKEPVTIVSDEKDDGSDEGRAMAQLVHGIAPGAKLLFADSGSSEIGMALNIEALVEAGADIIVDDISYLSEAYYQKGIISATVEEAKENFDVAYFTAAGNSTAVASSGPSEGLPNSSWQTNAYRPMECPAWTKVTVLQDGEEVQVPASEAGVDCMDFDPSESSEVGFDTLKTMQAAGGNAFKLLFYGAVGESLFGVTSDFQVQFYKETDSAAEPELIDEIGMIGGPFTTLVGEATLPLASNIKMVIVRSGHDTAAPLPALYTLFMQGGAAITERQFMGDNTHDWVGESFFGHAADGSAISVGAMDWEDPTIIRDYSSLGPGTLLFEPVAPPTPSARLAAPEIVDTPHIVAVDGTQTTFFTETGEDNVYRFDGTSAAAPNAAAVAALGLSYRPQLSGAELSDLTINTARDTVDGAPLVNPYASRFADEHVFGNGLVDGLALLEKIDELLPAQIPAAPTGLKAADRAVDSLTFTWDAPAAAVVTRAAGSDVPVDHYVIALFEGDADPENAVEASQLSDAQLPTSYRFDGLKAGTTYTVKLTAYGPNDRDGASADLVTSTLSKTPVKPEPEPKPDPAKPKPGPAKTGSLSNTGDEFAPWLGAAGIALLVAAAAAFAVSRRAQRK